MGTEANGAIGRLTEELGKLPGIGPKTAERLTHHLLAAGRGEVLALADALAIKEKLRRCNQCCQPTENDLCAIRRPAPRSDDGLRRRAAARPGRSGTLQLLSRPLPRSLRPTCSAGERWSRTAHRRPTRPPRPGGHGEGSHHGDQSDAGGRWHRPLPVESAGGRGRAHHPATRGLSSGSVLEFANNQMLADALEGRRAF